MRNQWKAYIKPFDDAGNYVDSWTEVSDDVDFNAIGSIAQDLDNTDYDIGVYRNSNFKLTLNNINGRYSDVGNETSIFRFKRSDSLFKLTWSQGPLPETGVAVSGAAVTTEEIDVFVGMINDDTASMSLKTQKIGLTVLGRESVFLRTIVPFGSINNGDLLSEVIFQCLNQASVTKVLTVDALNISLGIDQAIDSIASLQNKTVQEGLNKLLLASNSVLYIQNDTIYVQPREESPDFKFNFYGQGSPRGLENIAAIDNIKNGVAKTFNFFTWENTTLSVDDPDSVLIYGARKKQLSFEFITDSTKQGNIMQSLLDEFGLPKQEFDLQTPLNHGSIALGLLNKVSIDYPTIYLGTDFPICGIAICGDAVLPISKWAFKLDPLDGYKIMGRSVSIKNAMITFKMRAVT